MRGRGAVSFRRDQGENAPASARLALVGRGEDATNFFLYRHGRQTWWDAFGQGERARRKPV